MSLLKENKKYYPRTLKESKNYVHSFWRNELLRNMRDLQIQKLNENLEIKIINKKISLRMIEKTDDLKLGCNILTESYSENETKIIFTPELIETLALPLGILYGIYHDSTLIGCILVNLINYQVGIKEERLAKINLYGLKKEYQRRKISHDVFNLLKQELSEYTKSGIFNSDIYLESPIFKTKRFIRPLNYAKLHITKFLYESDEMQLNYNINKFKINANEYQSYVREYKKEDFDRLFEIYNKQISKFSITIKYNEDELRDILNNKNVNTYVIFENKDSNIISDFVSFYKYVRKNKNNEDIICGELLLITETNINYTLRRVLNITSMILFNNKVDLLVLQDNLNSSDILEEVDGYYIYTNSTRSYYLYNLGSPTFSNSEIGFL